MFFNSIRWRLQIWYGLILVAVLAGFGLTAFQLERGRQFRNIDENLQRRCSELMASFHVPRQGGPEERFSDRMPPPPPDGPSDGRPPDDGPPEGGLRPPEKFQLTPLQASVFASGEKDAPYYVVWRRDGRELARSANAPPGIARPPRLGPAEPELPRTRDSLREVFHFTPPGECVLSGRSIAGDLADMRRLGWLLAAVGGVVLLFGLAGGWWLVSRAIHPIAEISATAVKIAAGDLSQRINVADTENELGRLAGVLNSTFARLEAAFAQQGRFTADVAHELRTPVSVLLTQTQTALNRERNAVEYRETVEACQRAAQRMRRLLESMLELARLDAGQEPMKAICFDLAGTVRDCIELVRPLAEERNIKIQGELAAVELVGDPERLAQVITNLLSNAIHHNKENGEVRVSVQRRDKMVMVKVADTGPGISAEDLPHVFERFYRGDKSRSGASGRTGLGLAISKAIVEAHSGVVEVTSEIGVGTAFAVSLPARSLKD